MNNEEREISFFKLGYSIDKSGNVTNNKGKLLKLHAGSSGYMQVNCWSNKKQKTFLIHRLVAFCYIVNPDLLSEVNHKDGNKMNNNVSNLEWVTRSQNMKHGFSTGLIKKSMIERTGAKHWRSKEVIQLDNGIKINQFESTGDAARLTGYNKKSIQDACKNRIKIYKGFTWEYNSTQSKPQS